MEEKVFELLEKLYIEFTGFRTETNQRFDKLDGRMDGLDGRMDGLDGRMDGLEVRMDGLEVRFDKLEVRMDKLEFNQEAMNDKLDEAFEAISSHVEINERQHQEILKELRGEVSVVELAVKRIAK